MGQLGFLAPLRVIRTSMPPRTRVLDPSRPGPNTTLTAYNQDGLIVSAVDAGTVMTVASALRDALQPMNCDFEGPDWLTAPTAAPINSFTTGIKLTPRAGSSGIPDPWTVLMQLRDHPHPEVARSVSLNHVLATPEQLGGNPFAIGHGRIGLDSYGVPGQGGRGPVTFLAVTPARPVDQWSPRVVLLDTQVGQHSWFERDPISDSFELADGRIAGDEIHPYPRTDGAQAALNDIPDPLVGAIGTHSGHGTFISGLLRQACPGVEIIALPVMGTDGVVPEHMLIRALDLVLRKQLDQPGWADAIVMSLGYYNETADDLQYTSGLRELLLSLGRAGVAVFAAAGNDATELPSYPAAFAADPDFDQDDVLPLLSVGAVNPDGSAASFSNSGDWVVATAPGVNLVSTSPAMDGSASASLAGDDSAPRRSVDMDDFRGGFAAWSGTSFAAPVLAGQYLTALRAGGSSDSFAGRLALLRSFRRAGAFTPALHHSQHPARRQR